MEDTTAAPTAETSSATPAEISTSVDTSPPSFGDGSDDALTVSLSEHYDKITAPDTAVEPKESVPDGTVVESDQPANEVDETGEQGHASPSIDPPNSWSADAKAKWSAIPPDLQQVIAERERQAHEQITRQGETVKAFEPVTGYIEKHYPGANPVEMVGNLLNAEAYLKSDPVNAIKWLADSYNVDLAKQFGNQPSELDHYDDGFRDPRFDQVNEQLVSTRRELQEARQQIQKLGGFVQTHQQQQIQVKQQEIGSAIEEASKELPYFSELETEIVEETAFLRSRNPDMPAKEVLKRAHQRALNNSDTYRAKAEQDRKAKEAEEAAKKAAKSQQREATNVRGSTNGRAAPTRWDDDASLSAAYDRIAAS